MLLWLRVFPCVVTVALAGAPAGARQDGSTSTVRFEHAPDQAERTYRVRTPSSPDTAPKPLVVVLHDSGGSGEQIERLTDFSELAEKRGFVVVYPESLNAEQAWSGAYALRCRPAGAADDIAFISDTVARVRENHSIDPLRVYVTGLGRGAEMAATMALARPDVFAAVAPVGGEWIASRCSPEPGACVPCDDQLTLALPMPVWLWTSDPAASDRAAAWFRRINGIAQDQPNEALKAARASDYPDTTLFTGGTAGAVVFQTRIAAPLAWQPGMSEEILDFFVGFQRTRPDRKVAGDANGDGLVNAADVSVLMSQFGKAVDAGTGADFNADGRVDAADQAILRTQLRADPS